MEFVLFCSSESKKSIQCLTFIASHPHVGKMLKIVRLDTDEDRSAAKNGNTFSITHVPTLVVTYPDGNLQLFQGLPKVGAWLQKLSQGPQQAPRRNPHYVPPEEEEDDDDDDIMETPLEEGRSSGGLYSGKRSDSSGTSLRALARDKHHKSLRSSSPSPSPSPPSRKKSSKSSKKSSKSSGSKSKKSTRIESEDESESEIEFVPRSKSSKSSKGSSKSSKNKGAPKKHTFDKHTLAALSTQPRAKGSMKSIKDIARQMEEDRKRTLGYKEDELPRHS